MRFDRREFLGASVLGCGSLFFDRFYDLGADPYQKLGVVARAQKWAELPLGDRIVIAGRKLLGVEYVGSTLDGNPERCQVYLDKLDCVTFLEMSWALARCSPDITEARMRAAVTQTRYRGEIVNGYWSRLHYTTDFLEANRKVGKLKIVSDGFAGGVAWNPDTSYMSSRPERYGASKYVADFGAMAKKMEDQLSNIRFRRIPVDRWSENLKSMRAGDFLGFCTTNRGLDFSHVAIYSGNGNFIHASSSAGKVVEQDLVSWGKRIRTCNGMVVSRAQPFPLP